MKRLLTICLVAVMVLAVSGTVQGALVSYWSFDEGTGDTAYDSIGTNDGTVVGAIRITDGAIGDALQFRTDYVDRVVVPDSTTLEPATVSVAAWAKSDGSPGSYKYLVSKHYEGGYASYALYTGGAGGLYFYVSNGAYALSPGAAAAEVWDNEWHHIVGTYDGDYLRLYVDGVEVGGGTACTKAIGYDDGALYIGSYGAGYAFDNDGCLDEVAIWSHALSAEDVEAVHIYGVVICQAIKDGILTYSDSHYLAGELLPQKTDDFGYNYHTHKFKGYYANVYLGGQYGLPPYDGDDGDYFQRLLDEGFVEDPDGLAKAKLLAESTWVWPYRNVDLLMKWNDAWLSNHDCDADGKLDRHWGFDSYIGSGAWETNVQSGSYEAEINGKKTEFHWNYFCKIIAVPADAYVGDPEVGEKADYWYTADGEEIGAVIWGQFAITQEVYNDQGEGIHGQQYLSPSYPGLGNLTSEVMGSE